VHIRRTAATVTLYFTFWIGNAAQQPAVPVPEQVRIARLEALADLWGKMYLFHPKLHGGSRIDWNGVLVRAIPEIERAADGAALARVLNDVLLKPLGDPSTFAQVDPGPAQREPTPLSTRKLSDNVGYVDATDPSEHAKPDFEQSFRRRVAGLGPLKALVVDLRCAMKHESRLSIGWLNLFLDQPMDAGTYIYRVHHGWPRAGDPGSVYFSGWETGRTWLFRPAKDPITTPTLFLVNNGTRDWLDDVLARSPAVAWPDCSCVAKVRTIFARPRHIVSRRGRGHYDSQDSVEIAGGSGARH
jgi:CubicO group peptidase (beta-lactamase class C family)